MFNHFLNISLRKQPKSMYSHVKKNTILKFGSLCVGVVLDGEPREICRAKELRGVTVETQTQEGRRDTEDIKGWERDRV